MKTKRSIIILPLLLPVLLFVASMSKDSFAQQQIQMDQQQIKKVMPQKNTSPTQINPKTLEQIQKSPKTLSTPEVTQGIYEQRIQEYPPEEETKEGLDRPPKKKPLPEYPPEQEGAGGLAEQPRPSHPRPGCFIATAAYGSPLAEDIIVLEHFRDTYLLTNPIGRRIVALYYTHSPPLADYIARHETLKAITRTALWPLVFCIKYMMLAAIFMVAAGAMIGGMIIRRRSNRT